MTAFDEDVSNRIDWTSGGGAAPVTLLATQAWLQRREVSINAINATGVFIVRDLLDQDEASRMLDICISFSKVWRAIAGPVEVTRLGVCDARTVLYEDCIATDLRYGERGEILSFRYSDKQR